MSGPPRIRSTNIAEPENKPPPKKELTEPKDKKTGKKVANSILRQKSMNASCSSEASSSDSSHSRPSSSSSSSTSSGRMAGRRNVGVVRKKQCGLKGEKGGESDDGAVESGNKRDAVDGCECKRRCAWITPTTDPCYATFHDEEWGVPVHDDKKLFELLSLAGALAELTWPAILNKRHIFREVFLDFNPISVSKLSDRKIATPGSAATSLLSELKLRSIIENARQVCKVIAEFGSFDKYIWNLVNHKPIVNQFRYSRQVPVKTPKAEVISKDLVRRGFRSVGPTVIYSFMQVAGLTNDHLISCFRFQECINRVEVREKDDSLEVQTGTKELNDPIDV